MTVCFRRFFFLLAQGGFIKVNFFTSTQVVEVFYFFLSLAATSTCFLFYAGRIFLFLMTQEVRDKNAKLHLNTNLKFSITESQNLNESIFSSVQTFVGVFNFEHSIKMTVNAPYSKI